MSDFFDSGANTHLINGDLAKKEKLQTISKNHSALGVIRGGTITTDSGNFRLNLGSGKEGICHEIRAIGIKNVTLELGEYGLEEIGKEFAFSATETEKEYILPKMVGGSKFHLLLGVKNTRIQPVFLRVLPSGVEVNLSPFKDVWVSRIIFAGPSKLFTQLIRINKKKLFMLYTLSGKIT